MNLINQFGRMVSSESLKDPEKARRLLLMASGETAEVFPR
mgnify:CR=1 FL=1